MILFAAQDKNKQSQLSILSEGVDTMKNNVQMIGGGIYNGDVTPLKVMMDCNYMSNNNMDKVLNQVQSKESLYNELLSTFDFSVTKKEKDKIIDLSKKQVNQTQSTMSLFSSHQLNQVSVEIQKKKKKESKEDKDKSFSQKIEFQKNARKYSPDIDLSRVIN